MILTGNQKSANILSNDKWEMSDELNSAGIIGNFCRWRYIAG